MTGCYHFWELRCFGEGGGLVLAKKCASSSPCSCYPTLHQPYRSHKTRRDIPSLYFSHENCIGSGGGSRRRVTIPLADSHRNYQDLLDSSTPVRDSNSDGDPEDNADRTAGTSQRPEVDGDASIDGLKKDLAGVEEHTGDGEGIHDPEQMWERGEGEPPFPKGSFFIKVDDKDKGHYRVRDVSRFLLTSMYKRKDRVTRTPGVSLLVGKLEEPPHEEKVISALFDTDRFSERAAARWWEDNGHRFEDAGSLAEKKVRVACLGEGEGRGSWRARVSKTTKVIIYICACWGCVRLLHLLL